MLLLLLFLLAVFASSEVERVQHLVKGSACFASIQIRVPGYPASDALNGNTSTQAGNSIVNNMVVLKKCQKNFNVSL